MASVPKDRTQNLCLVDLVIFSCGILPLVATSTSTSKYEEIKGTLLYPVFATSSADSPIECCTMCSSMTKCVSVNYNTDSRTCDFVALPDYAIFTDDLSEPWKVFTTDSSIWSLVFVGVAGIGTDMHDAWVNGNDVTSDVANCVNLNVASCLSHYRSTMVNDWATLGITQVRFSVIKDKEEKQYVIFDGSGSDHMNWFQKERILESSWPSLPSETFNFFSIEGLSPSRRFHINLNHGGCPMDRGYIAVITSDYLFCTYDKQSAYPTILYAENSTPIVFESSAGIGSLRLSVRLWTFLLTSERCVS